MTFEVDYAASLQVGQLTPSERNELEQLFNQPDPPARQVPGRGPEPRFVSSLATKRVLWRRRNNGAPLVLSVVDNSYAA